MSGDEDTGLTEDQRQAASIQVATSNYVAAAALAVLAAAVVLYTYISQNFESTPGFYVTIGIGAFLLVAAIFSGGRGSARVAKEVGRGEWDSQKVIGEYNWQAIFTLVGLAFILGAAAIGVTSSHQPSDMGKQLDQIVKALDQLGHHAR